MNIRFTLTLVLLSVLNMSQAQTIEYSNVFKFRSRNSGAILENNSIAGYYNFYAVEKVDKKNMAYWVNFYDNNLNKATEFEITRDKKSYLIETVYNQEAFMMMFYQKKTLEFVTYDRNGKKLGSKMLEDLPNMELARLNQAASSEDIENTTVFPIGKSGFVRSTFTKDGKYGYELEAYDNKMGTMWTYASPPKSDMVELCDILYCTDKFIGLSVVKKKSAMSSKVEYYFVMLDAKTGKEFYNIPVEDEKNAKMSLLNCFIDDNGQAALVGEFYLPNDEVFKDKSQGLYIRTLALDGSDLIIKKCSWARDIANLKKDILTAEEKEKDKGTNQVWFHKIIKGANGHIYCIGEQYRKQISAGGVAMKALSGGGASAMEIKVTNMLVVEFDAKLELVDYEMVAKKTTRVMLPEGYGLASPQMLAAYLVSTGGFDYQFTSADSKADRYQVVYTDCNRSEEKSKEKADIMIGVIDIDKTDKKMARLPINSEARYVWYRPAKPGYILVGEYFKKEKKIVMHLEKIE
jgi:hypothetical protein